jgi:hypothetical protein
LPQIGLDKAKSFVPSLIKPPLGFNPTGQPQVLVPQTASSPVSNSPAPIIPSMVIQASNEANSSEFVRPALAAPAKSSELNLKKLIMERSKQ